MASKQAMRLAALLLSALPASARIREDLLREAQTRLSTWYTDKALLEMPWFRDGATLQITKKEGHCDAAGKDSTVPVTFGEFPVEDARPIDVFNALADTSHQKDWDQTIGQVNMLGDFEDEGVRGLRVTYPTGVPLIPDREVFEWTAFNASLATDEFWFVFSTQQNERLHAVMDREGGAVAAQNCLGAYRIARTAKGTHVWFTQQINPHPPLLISARTVFDISWSKQVDFFNAVRKRAQELYKKNPEQSEVALPAWLLQAPAGQASSGSVRFQTSKADLMVQLSEEMPLGKRWWQESTGRMPLLLFAGFAALAISTVFFARRRIRAQRWEQLLPGEEQGIEETSA
eukprot:TRINITY_DN8114_c0_g1_i2.p1 TRINITY_DN8114_c0_g1~~TRINITY_DN8114_c0_g1_i2.p1  ORF type:complete len:368 (+),score=96.10 TRINITY_DN8114_c0_g1_i2:70-1104(+)